MKNNILHFPEKPGIEFDEILGKYYPVPPVKPHTQYMVVSVLNGVRYGHSIWDSRVEAATALLELKTSRAFIQEI